MAKLPISIPANVSNQYIDGVFTIDKMADFSALPNALLKDGATVYMRSFHEGLMKGSGPFTYDPDMPRTEHNGGTVISPAKVFPDNWNDQAQVETWFDGSGENGNGCFVKNHDTIYVEDFGAFGDNTNNDVISLNKAVQEKGHIVARNTYLVDGTVYLPETNILLDGKKTGKINFVGNHEYGISLLKDDRTTNYFEGRDVAVKDIEINGSVKIGIYFIYGIYNCEISGVTVREGISNICIKADNCWTMRIKDNTFVGGDINLWIGGGNAMLVDRNRFMSALHHNVVCTVSELTSENNRSLTITDNVMEYSQKSPVVIEASKIIDIQKNYIEACAREYTSDNAYIEVRDIGKDIKTINIENNVFKDPETDSYTWLMSVEKAILINFKHNVIDHFVHNLFKIANVREFYEEGNDYFGQSNATINIDGNSYIRNNSKQLIVNNRFDNWIYGDNSTAGGYCCVDNVYINKSGADIEASKVLLEPREFSGSGKYALKLSCTKADDNWGIFLKNPMNEILSYRWALYGAWLKADRVHENIEIATSLYVKDGVAFTSSNIVSVSETWSLYYFGFGIYEKIDKYDNSYLQLSIINKDNTDGELFIANPFVALDGRIPSTLYEYTGEIKPADLLERRSVYTINGDVVYSHNKVRPVRTTSATNGATIVATQDAFKLSHTTEEIVDVIIDAQI